ncbi:hypothetical protein [Candidatus Frankia nodulisporulans]|uniref:hypothetical protein n=1 Tax=Candidatus Frankia nodulisporulans TaxID=2060052 RepID=UPI0015837B10|nr:hypothetical protein [Candidatus Frankia nodulisporulans]
MGRSGRRSNAESPPNTPAAVGSSSDEPVEPLVEMTSTPLEPPAAAVPAARSGSAPVAAEPVAAGSRPTIRA